MPLENLTAPTITHFPTAAEINQLVHNIETVRTGAGVPLEIGLSVLKTTWLPGNGAPAPDYTDVNAWEENLRLLHALLPVAAGYVVSCGVAAAGQARFFQHRWR